jgi:hypothetical protein
MTQVECEKIPKEAKALKAIVMGGYAIFCQGFLKAANVTSELHSVDKKKGIPAYGFIMYKKEKVYYCRYGFINSPDIYDNEQLKDKHGKNQVGV